MIKRKLLFPPIHFIGGRSIDDENKELMYKITNIIKKVKNQQDKYPIIKQIDEYLGVIIKEGKIYLKNKLVEFNNNNYLDNYQYYNHDNQKYITIGNNPQKLYIVGDNLESFNNPLNINSNFWKKFCKKMFIPQHEYYYNKFSINKDDEKEIKVNNIKLKNFTQTIIKNYESMGENFKNDERKVFSLSIFLKPNATFRKDIEIKYGGSMNFDDYVIKESQKRNISDIWPKITEAQNKPEKSKRDIKTYIQIMIDNIKLYTSRFPNWLMYIYTDKSILKNNDPELKKLSQYLSGRLDGHKIPNNVVVIDCQFNDKDIIDDNGNNAGIAVMNCRFFPMFDPNVITFVTIEADNTPTEPYFNIIENWSKSDKKILNFNASYPYGWPSGDIVDNKLVYFSQCYGGMFGMKIIKNKALS